MKRNIVIGLLALLFSYSCYYLGHQVTKQNKDREILRWQIRCDEQEHALQKVSENGVQYAQAAARTMSRDEFKELFKEQYDLIKKELQIKQVDHYTEAQTVTTHYVKTTLRDSITRDTTHVKVFSYTSPSLKLKGYTTQDSAFVAWKHYLNLQIASGKKPRENFWKKITLSPLHRETLVKAIPSDTNTVITNIKSISIK